MLPTANSIPDYIQAGSPRALRLKMLQTNAKLGGFVQYFDIQKSDGKWIAWFFRDVGTFGSIESKEQEQEKI